MIRITGYRVIAEKPRVGKLGQFFRAPCRKNYALDQKMNVTFLMGTMSSITVQSLGKIALGAPAVGACCMFFFVCNSVTLRGRRAVSSRVTYFEQVLCRCLLFDFDDASFFQH